MAQVLHRAEVALEGGDGNVSLGNWITQISNDTAQLPTGSNKTFHAVYFNGNNFEFAWNKIDHTAAYNGFQVHHDYSLGFYNLAVHDNDIADVNGSGINISAVDPTMGYVEVYNNVIHHTGLAWASDGGYDNPHNCIASKGNAGPDTITSYSVASNVVTLNAVGSNIGFGFFGGETITFSNLTSASFLNGQQVTVLTSPQPSQTQIWVNFTHANVSNTTDNGYALHPTYGVVTNGALTSNVVTLTGANTFTAGQTVIPQALTTFSFLNGQTLTVVSATGTQFTANFPHANVSSTADAGYVAPTASNLFYSNTMYDCSSILNAGTSSSGENESGAIQVANQQLNVDNIFIGNLVYQPAYTYSGSYNVYFNADGANGNLAGSGYNWFYSVTTPGSTSPAGSYGTVGTDPVLANATPCSPGCSYLNYEVQSGSGAIGAGTRVGPVHRLSSSNTYLTWDILQNTRTNPPTIGAFDVTGSSIFYPGVNFGGNAHVGGGGGGVVHY